jgi:DnaK suppressor protein
MIEAAPRRIAEGTFGLCAACGDDIPRKRLEALPWTDRCLRCQEIAEWEMKLESSPQAPNAGPWKRAG